MMRNLNYTALRSAAVGALTPIMRWLHVSWLKHSDPFACRYATRVIAHEQDTRSAQGMSHRLHCQPRNGGKYITLRCVWGNGVAHEELESAHLGDGHGGAVRLFRLRMSRILCGRYGN